MISFAALGLSPAILRALAEEGYQTPTPIQAQTITPALQGRDLLACAQTGTGKTAAFALPILQRLSNTPRSSAAGHRTPRALILAPTRELATQIGASFDAYGRYAGLSHTVVFGGVSQFHQVKALQRGVDVLVATPGRLLDLIQQRLVVLGRVEILVLDEADRMLDMGFIQPIRRIVAAVPPGAARQTMLFSATLPASILGLAHSLLNQPVRVSVTPTQAAPLRIEQSVYMVPRARKAGLLRHLLTDGAIQRAVVFTRTKHGAERLHRHLVGAGIASAAIHGDRGQNQRRRALEDLRAARVRVLVATDVAARGLDVDGISHVFNFDLPVEPESYVHRIGRTGRAGAAGVALSFCDTDERPLLRDIERLTGARIASAGDLPDFEDVAAPAVHKDRSRAAPSAGWRMGGRNVSTRRVRAGRLKPVA